LVWITRIVECTSGSRVPDVSNAKDQGRGLSRKAAGFVPWLLTFRGEPREYLFDVQERYLPSVEVVRVANNGSYLTLEEADGCTHCDQVGCESTEHESVIHHYCETFFGSSMDPPERASTFRYQTADLSTRSKSRHDQLLYTMDMESAYGKRWEYRREKDIGVAKIGSLLHNQLSYEEWGTHGVSLVILNQRFDAVSDVLLVSGDLTKFDDLHFESITGSVEDMQIRTYICVRPGACIHSSFSYQALWEFESTLREMAEDCLDLNETAAELSFQLFVHHGHEPCPCRSDMTPVFSVSYSPTEKGNRVAINQKWIDQDFLHCAKNKGCKRCKVANKS
jgi:hypothetical protein